jgi:hypothetical protein
VVNEGVLSEEEKEMVRNASCIEIGKRREEFANYLVEEVFRGTYQIANDTLIHLINSFEGDDEKVRDLTKFLERHHGKKVFIRAE